MIDTYATTYTNGPEYESIEVSACATLKVIRNDREINGNHALTQIMIFENEMFTRYAIWNSTGLSDLHLGWDDWVTYRQSNWRYVGEYVASETKSYPSGAKELIVELPWVNTDFTYSYSFYIIATSTNMNNEEMYRLGSYDKMVNGTPQAGGASVKIDRRNKTIKVNSVYYNSASQSLSNMRFRIYYR